MTDNQQQQQMNIASNKTVGELLALGAGGAVIGLIFIKGLHWACPELFDGSLMN